MPLTNNKLWQDDFLNRPKISLEKRTTERPSGKVVEQEKLESTSSGVLAIGVHGYLIILLPTYILFLFIK